MMRTRKKNGRDTLKFQKCFRNNPMSLRFTLLLKTSAFLGHLRLKATPRRRGTVKETREVAMFMYGIGISFPIIGLKRLYSE